MIKAITVTNFRGESLKLELARPENSGFIVTEITGLGPGKATVNTVETSTNDGSMFNSARVPSRNIVISLRYMWKATVEEVRQLSYKYFPIKKPLKLKIETDNRNLEIEGYVESNEPNIFSKEESADISIICAFPFFTAIGDGQITIFSGVEPLFEFPFSNESLIDPLIVMGEIRNKTDNVIVYNGDVETGVLIKMHAVGSATNIAIYNTITREVIRLDTDKIASYTGSGIVYGDDIIISTVTGSKYCRLIRGGKTYNILNCLEKNPAWFQLSKGENVFVYVAETGSSNLQFRIENKIVYEGV